MQNSVEVASVASLHSDAQAMLEHFSDRLRTAPLLGHLAADSPTHPKLPRLAFSFAADDVERILRRGRASLIVHHGVALARRGLTMFPLLIEHLMPFAPIARGPLALSRAELASILAGRITTWRVLGHGTGSIELLAHGDSVHDRLLRAFAARDFGLRELAPMQVFPTYSDLAAAARKSDRCLVLGLRPAHMEAGGLAPATIEGSSPWSIREPVRYPSLPIHIAWREGAERTETHRRDLARFLDAVLERLHADACALDAMGEFKTLRAA